VRSAPAKPTLRQRIARWLAPSKPGVAVRSYGGARNTRTTVGFGSSGNTSADSELSSSLSALRARSRQMIRDSAYAKRAQLIIVNNVIGTGVGMQAQVETVRNARNDRINDAIETAYAQWCAADSCHTGGVLHFSDLERAAMGQVFEAGEIFIRKHYRVFGDSRVPLGLELIEAERLATELVDPSVSLSVGNAFRMGIEVDSFGRPIAYWIRTLHPGDLRAHAGATDRYERVPAADIFHLRVVERWPQARGVPWMHTSVRKLDALNEYAQYEVDAARASAAYFATITTGEGENPLPTTEQTPGQSASAIAASGGQMMDIEPLTIQELRPGEELHFHTPNRPNPGLDPFMRAMLREVAAGCGPSYESLSKDYSQSNYSSSRLALLDDRDLYKALQQWWIRAFRQPLHKLWLRQAVLAGAIEGLSPAAYAVNPDKYNAVLFKPRGWSWVDPTKEVAAYKEAIKAGLTTLTDVIAATGGGMDIEDVVKTRKRELDMLKDAGIDVDTTVVPAGQLVAGQSPAAAAPVDDPQDQNNDPNAAGEDDITPPARVLQMKRG
jgi:lambda family phage portal protein